MLLESRPALMMLLMVLMVLMVLIIRRLSIKQPRPLTRRLRLRMLLLKRPQTTLALRLMRLPLQCHNGCSQASSRRVQSP